MDVIFNLAPDNIFMAPFRCYRTYNSAGIESNVNYTDSFLPDPDICIRWSDWAIKVYRKLFGCWAGSLSKSRVCLRVFLICGQRVDCKRSLCTPTDLGSKNNISSRGILTTRFLRQFLSQDFPNIANISLAMSGHSCLSLGEQSEKTTICSFVFEL